MPGEQFTGEYTPIIRVVGGKFAQQCNPDTPKAQKREYERKDGTKAVKYELVYTNWEGKVTDVSFRDSDFGEECINLMEDVKIILNTNSSYFTDFAKKLPAIDLTKPVKLHPYSMEINDKKTNGMSIQQNGEKLKSVYWDLVNQKVLGGFPEVNRQEAAEKKSYWKIYFLEVEEFLIKKLKEMKFNTTQTEEAKEVFKEITFEDEKKNLEE